MKQELQFIKEEGITYPIGLLNDVRIYFQHYENENQAKEAWNRRRKRMNYNNLFVLFTDRDGCTRDDLVEFDSLPYENKVAFVHLPYPNLTSTVYIKGFENQNSVGICSFYCSNTSYKKYYDYFDYVSWFNTGLIKRKYLMGLRFIRKPIYYNN